MKHKVCILCSSEKIEPLPKFYEKKGLVKCRNCNLVFTERIPSPEELKDYYSQYSYASTGYLPPATVNSYQKLLDEFEPYRKGNRILDVGCGRGWFLEEAQKRGWEVYGVEYSSEAVNVCKKKGINIREGALSEVDFGNTHFDVITSFEVIEHLNNPNPELQCLYKILRAGGLFYCTTPNFDSILRYYFGADYNIIGYPEHLSYYTKSTLNRLAAMHGFKISKTLSTGISLEQFKKTNEKSGPQNSADEQLRIQIDQKNYLRIAKHIVNKLLTLTNKGLTLKGYYTKPELSEEVNFNSAG